MDSTIDWFIDRGHQIVYSCVVKSIYEEKSETDARIKEIGSLWRFLVVHLLLQVQKAMQTKFYNKGNTVFIFDNKDADKPYFTDIVLSTPEWSYTYYKKKEPLDQIIDVPHFVDSKHVVLIQLADLFAYILRRDIEIKENLIPKEFDRDAESMNSWAKKIRSISIPKNNIYPKRDLCSTAELINSLAPDSIK